MLDSFIKELEKELEVDFNQIGVGTYTIPIAEKMAVEISPFAQGFQCTCTMGTAPENEEEVFLEKLLHANLFGIHTKNAILGLNEKLQLTLIQNVESLESYRNFKDTLEDFINMAIFWDEESKEHKEIIKK